MRLNYYGPLLLMQNYRALSTAKTCIHALILRFTQMLNLVVVYGVNSCLEKAAE